MLESHFLVFVKKISSEMTIWPHQRAPQTINRSLRLGTSGALMTGVLSMTKARIRL